jgi:hypothetical protein
VEFIRGALGIDEDSLGEVLETLVEERAVVIDEFREPELSDGEEVCDAGNLEILLRMRRAAVRPTFEPLEAADLPRCLAVLQGLCPSGEGLDDLEERLERLFGYPARAVLWESDILPARLEPYYSEWLDTALLDSDLMWFGCGRERVAFAFEPDMDLFPPDDTGDDSEAVHDDSAGPGNSEYSEDGDEERLSGGMDAGAKTRDESESLTHAIERFFSGAGASRLKGTGGMVTGEHALSGAGDNAGFMPHSTPGVGLDALMGALKQPADAISDSLWELAWRGRVTNDGFEAVRRGIMNRFRAEKAPESSLRSSGRRRIGFARWRNTRSFAGTWRAVGYGDAVGRDALDEQEIEKDRVRQLFLRYGVLFRELVANELPSLRWGRLFRTLRLMELSGEVFAGNFFKGVPGLQFSSREALRMLGGTLPGDAVFWMNACDPASLCGIGVDALRGGLPPRLPTTHLVYHDRDIVLVSRRNGSELTFTAGPDHPRIADYLAFFRTLLGRRSQPLKHVETETINGVSAVESPYRAALTDFGFVREYRSLVLRKRF